MEEASTENKSSGYGKRPMWQWILIYLVVALVLYGGFYYFFLAKAGNNTANPYGSSQSASPTTAASNKVTSSSVYMTKTDTAKGAYLTDSSGKTLYTYDKDTTGVSNCYGGCATAWPPYVSGSTTVNNLPANITLVTRTDGTKQFAWKGMPLYYYATDQKPGDITGDGVGGVFHIIKP